MPSSNNQLYSLYQQDWSDTVRPSIPDPFNLMQLCVFGVPALKRFLHACSMAGLDRQDGNQDAVPEKDCGIEIGSTHKSHRVAGTEQGCVCPHLSTLDRRALLGLSVGGACASPDRHGYRATSLPLQPQNQSNRRDEPAKH